MNILDCKITQEYIDRGCRASRTHCPIGLFLRKATGKEYVVNVEDCGFGMISIPLPEIAQDFIADFDAGRPVKPIEFQVDLDDITIKAN